MLRLQGCVYLFEWATPVVCSDATHTSDCRLTDSKLQFTFDLSTLSGEVQVSSVRQQHLVTLLNIVVCFIFQYSCNIIVYKIQLFRCFSPWLIPSEIPVKL